MDIKHLISIPDRHRRISRFPACVVSLTILVFSLLLLPSLHAGSCAPQDPDDSYPMFSCETNRPGKIIQIRGVEDVIRQRWSNIQYSFGREHEPPEMVYPTDPAQGARSLFFSHEYRDGGADYYVSIRFTTGGYTYRVYCHTPKGGAGVTVTNAQGKEVSTIPCIESPSILASYLQRELACDLKNPHGKAACGEKPYQPAK